MRNPKKIFFDLLYIAMIIALIVFMVWIVKFMQTEAKQCMKDPIKYFEAKNEGASCSCMKDGIFYDHGGENKDLIVIPNNFNSQEASG